MKERREAFQCQMCGHCCFGEGGIVVTLKDQQRLCALLGLDLESFRTEYTLAGTEKRVLKTSGEGYCVFFRTGLGCSVHSHKPDICRAWPFFRGNLQDELSWKMAQDLCPGIAPEVGHREFVRQGMRYLQAQEIAGSNEPDAPKALIVDLSGPDPDEGEPQG
jgi:hypothetical protein